MGFYKAEFLRNLVVFGIFLVGSGFPGILLNLVFLSLFACLVGIYWFGNFGDFDLSCGFWVGVRQNFYGI